MIRADDGGSRARPGDDGFAELVRPYEHELRVHCYRMLGSLHDAEDALQETLLSAWQALPGFEGRSSLRTWLYRIATSRCLNAVRAGARRPPTAPLPPFDVPAPSREERVTWCEPHPHPAPSADDPLDVRHGLEYAFLCALHSLPPRQTAALVLCDVLDFTVAECAEMLESSPTAVKGLLQRARAAMPPNDPLAAPKDELRLAERLARAYAADDVDGVLALLTDRSWLAMPPAPHRYDGREAIGRFLRASAAGRGARYAVEPSGWAGGHPVFRCLIDGEDRGLLMVIAASDGATVSGVVRFLG
ncbi:RNA polymerase sigma-70 factor (TIGR02960 family) [Microbacterium natoriense]|uniref:RNA polymerase sigma-70 factor (TIGR02960 family) n=1 Tax=Microbacterium natoriense TaxID=284570 RepID=A0AAW8ER95_9MICO|nr:RNA polymerase subunit sigma-70 [Microbacterium natoriense]MDQ0646033.1 RNA polymerase sigma-70 factor (TIGR02960 family) [Microbacterium natoriense]